jgi:hypothetical protein
MNINVVMQKKAQFTLPRKTQCTLLQACMFVTRRPSCKANSEMKASIVRNAVPTEKYGKICAGRKMKLGGSIQGIMTRGTPPGKICK